MGQGRQPVAVDEVATGSRCQHPAHHTAVPPPRRLQKGRATALVGTIRLGAGGEQGLDDIRTPVAGLLDEGRSTRPVGGRRRCIAKRPDRFCGPGALPAFAKTTPPRTEPTDRSGS